MYFFRSIIIILLIIMSSFMLYQYLSTKKNTNISKKTIILSYLIFIEGLLILFGTNYLFFIFLDFSCFLAYMLNRRREALILSFINIVYFLVVLDLSWTIYLIYGIYFAVSYFLRQTNNQEKMLKILLIIKSFITSFIYFSIFEQSNIQILYLSFSLLYFYMLLELSYLFLREFEEKNNDDTIIFQIAHEVKNPIAVCKGYLDMLDTTKKDKINKYIPIIKSEMNRALTIMDVFLNLKRLTVQKDIMDLYMLIEDVDATMQSILSSKNVLLEIPTIDDELLIDGDYERLKQVFINLIKNAYEANANKIKIDVRTKRDYIEVDIIDNGDGISTKNLKKIGQLFYTTKIKGTGIGVNMSKEIIKLHQGTIKYIPNNEKGITVSLVIPSKFLID
ncbi:MAG: HAMP domain-containing histidine kinase [Tenericutes bacterium]|nr:HAMP domain-containing histidine kinase [Mycoplasmatota bacterium]